MGREQPSAPDDGSRLQEECADAEAPAMRYLPVHLAVMQPGTLAPVDLHIHVGPPAEYILYKKARDELREEIRERLLQHGVQMLYIRETDEDKYQDYVEHNLSAIIRDDLMPENKAAELVYETSSRVMEDTFREPRAGRNLQRAHTMVEATVMAILKDPESVWHMAAIAGHDYYTFTHCVHVSMFLVAAAQDLMGIRDRHMLEQIGGGGILHDIGKSRIPAEVLNKPGRLTAEEWEMVKQHPRTGLQLVRRDRRLRSAGARIVEGHHEHYDGSGYPRGLAGEGIARIVRLSTVVDVFDALTTERCYAAARSPFDALEMMLEQMEGTFDQPLLGEFIKFLGPKEMRKALRARWDGALADALERKMAVG
ncbi:MAG: HD domain-containing phosphohydrolase [Candidatus Brocadiia bacterium]